MAAGVTPTLRLDLSLWNISRLGKLLLMHPMHLLESNQGKLRVIGGFRFYALANALAVNGHDPPVLALVRKGKLSPARRKEIIEEEIFALPAFFRHLPGEASAVFQLYFDQFGGSRADAMIAAGSQGKFFQATGFDRRSARRPQPVSMPTGLQPLTPASVENALVTPTAAPPAPEAPGAGKPGPGECDRSPAFCSPPVVD